jgi:adenylylsulfate kinase
VRKFRRLLIELTERSENGTKWIYCAVYRLSEPKVRDEIRAKIRNFLEIYVKCLLEILIMRDTKELYQKALKGEIKHLSGI